MISKRVKILKDQIYPQYYENFDLDFLERAINTVEEDIASSGEELDEEDKVFLIYARNRVNFYKYGYSFPADLLDRCVLSGYISAIDYAIRNSKCDHLTPEIVESIKESMSKIFKSNNKKIINRLSYILTNSIDYEGNALNLSQENSEKIATAAESYEKGITEILIGETYVHVDQMSVSDWRLFVITLFQALRENALNEVAAKSYDVNKILYLRVWEDQLEIYFKGHRLVRISIDLTDPYAHELTDIIGRIKIYLAEHTKATANAEPKIYFVSELEPKNPHVDWLNLPATDRDIIATLFRPE